ncbi:MAG: hypothetical protein LBH80_01865 [Prevotellaceae bacterium]|jgi:hypothetical protein|nr:hypothetical protein [Prevotellaceae bacterium]
MKIRTWFLTAIILLLILLYLMTFDSIATLFAKLKATNLALLSGLITGLASSFLIFILTYFLTNKDEKELIRTSIEKSVSETVKAIHINCIFLQTSKIKDLNGKNYYDGIYNVAKKIHLCGIAPEHLIRNICKKKKEKSNWVKKLRERENVEVRIIFLNPASKLVSLIEQREKKATGQNVSDRLTAIIHELKEFATRHSDVKLAKNTSLVIKLSNQFINYGISYIEAENSNNPDKMFISLFDPTDANGPRYEIRKEGDVKTTFQNCKNQLDFLWQDSETVEIFSWTDKGIKFSDDENAIKKESR